MAHDRRREAVGKLVWEHADDEGNSIWACREEVLTREEPPMVAGFSQRGPVMVGRRSACPRQPMVRGGAWSSGGP
jgi:hypothetical protein